MTWFKGTFALDRDHPGNRVREYCFALEDLSSYSREPDAILGHHCCVTMRNGCAYLIEDAEWPRFLAAMKHIT